MLKHIIAGVALLAATAPIAAQNATTPATQPGSKDDPGTPRAPLPTDRGYDKPQVRTEAINTQSRDAVAAANVTTPGNSVNGATVRADLQAQYDADMAAWMSEMRTRNAIANANEAEYAARQRAYADAMYVWRMQVEDCKRGYLFACNRPTPNPAAFR